MGGGTLPPPGPQSWPAHPCSQPLSQEVSGLGLPSGQWLPAPSHSTAAPTHLLVFQIWKRRGSRDGVLGSAHCLLPHCPHGDGARGGRQMQDRPPPWLGASSAWCCQLPPGPSWPVRAGLPGSPSLRPDSGRGRPGPGLPLRPEDVAHPGLQPVPTAPHGRRRPAGLPSSIPRVSGGIRAG